MSAALDTRQQVLDAAITGVFRVAEAILDTPAEKRNQSSRRGSQQLPPNSPRFGL